MINSRMREALRQIEALAYLDRTELQPQLNILSNSRIVSTKDCWLLEPLIPEGFNLDAALQDYEDRTDLECSINEVHIEDFLVANQANHNVELLTQGILYACQLCANLKRNGDFKVVLGFESPNLTESSEFSSCTVRFHSCRTGQENWLSSELDSYQDAVLFLDSLDCPPSSEKGFLWCREQMQQP